jgi:hypothetical protein
MQQVRVRTRIIFGFECVVSSRCHVIIIHRRLQYRWVENIFGASWLLQMEEGLEIYFGAGELF